jgi:hypothetical protein
MRCNGRDHGTCGGCSIAAALEPHLTRVDAAGSGRSTRSSASARRPAAARFAGGDPVLIEPLSARGLDVLRCLPAAHQPEIAEELFVCSNLKSTRGLRIGVSPERRRPRHYGLL